ncbi:MAG: hypothetical protein LBJ18_00360 [Rickettsiales bacterium]|jgi:hypothetical protein|nr:hypothetical protein [Rickettsiales bacterium]
MNNLNRLKAELKLLCVDKSISEENLLEAIDRLFEYYKLLIEIDLGLA